MKPTLNEEIGMSQEGIDYVNSLEVKEPEKIDAIEAAIKCIKESEFNPNHIRFHDGKELTELFCDSIKNNIPDELERIRIRQQARNAWIFVFLIILITVIVNYYGGK